VMCRSCCREASKLAAQAKRDQVTLNAKGKHYTSRNANLQRLGIGSYREYLASDLWKDVRSKVYAVKGSHCYLCGNPATELHHNRYHKNDLVGKRLKYINPICRPCHDGIEFNQEGEKVTLQTASRLFKRRRREHNTGEPVRNGRAKVPSMMNPPIVPFIKKRNAAGKPLCLACGHNPRKPSRLKCRRCEREDRPIPADRPPSESRRTR
jgi:hypothetical protein